MIDRRDRRPHGDPKCACEPCITFDLAKLKAALPPVVKCGPYLVFHHDQKISFDQEAFDKFIDAMLRQSAAYADRVLGDLLRGGSVEVSVQLPGKLESIVIETTIGEIPVS